MDPVKLRKPSQGTIQNRLEKAFSHKSLVGSTQRRRVLQYIVDYPDQLTHHINAAASCGNISHVVTNKARPALREAGLAIYCYRPVVTHMTQFDEVSHVHAWRAELIEDYDAEQHGGLT